MMRTAARARPVVVAVAGLLVVACATTSIVRAWVNPEAAANKPKKLLIVGVSGDDTTRPIFENDFVRKLKARGLEAVPSYSRPSGGGRPTQQEVVAAIKNSGADSVLVTRIKGTEARTDFSYRYQPRPGPGGCYGFHSSAWPSAMVATPTVYQYDLVNAETGFCRAGNEKLLISVMTRTFDLRAPQREIQPFVSLIIEQMASGGLL